MIRLIQRKLIIPRGDTGSFAMPIIKAAISANDIAVFTIFDSLTKTKVFEKKSTIDANNNGIIIFDFNHNETVNLPVGKYLWDIKFYTNPQYANDELVNGEEIDSYYAGFTLPECEIRETGDSLLVSPESPSATLTPEALDIVSAALTDLAAAVDKTSADAAATAADVIATAADVEKTNANVEHYPYVGENNRWYVWNAQNEQFEDTNVSATGPGIIDGGSTGQFLKKKSNTNFDMEWGNETDPTVPSWAKQPTKPSYTPQEVGALPNNTFIPSKVSDLDNDSGFLITETDPTVPSWAKQQNKPSYTAQEVGALPNNTFIPTKVSDLTDDSGHYTKPVSGIPASDLADNVIPDISVKADKVSNATNGNFASLDSSGNLVDSGHKHSDYLTEHQDISGKLDTSLKGIANGLAELDSSGKVPSSQLPSYVDDVLEYNSIATFPMTGQSDKIYIADDTNKTYRWSGSSYIEISASIALGETSSTAYRGDRGKIAYDHAFAKGSAFESGLYKITTNSEGHITNASAVEKSDITALGIPAQDTTYESKAAASGGNDVSLVTTGEKYTWNSKYDKPVNGIPANDLASGVVPDVTGKADKVSNAGEGNFAALDSNGNLTDSGHNHTDYLTSFTETDPTVPAWAKEASKPTYTASEVGLGNVANERQYSANNPPPSDTAKQDKITASGILKGDGNGGVSAAVAGTDYIASHQDISGKADKVANATNGNFASLDANGNLTDSGHKHSDYLTAHQTIPVTDVQINGASILNNGVANVPVASTDAFGAVKTYSGRGLTFTSDKMHIAPATSTNIKAGSDGYLPVVSSKQHESTFYGLAKAAGDSTQSASSNAVGTYTEEAQKKIRKMLGTASDKWELIANVTVSEDTESFEILTDTNGQPFKLSKIHVRAWLEPSTTGTADFISATNCVVRTSDQNTTTSAPTVKYATNGVKTFFEYRSEIMCGICYSFGSSSSVPGSTASVNKISSNLDDLVYIRGFKLFKYSSATSLIPKDSIIKIYGIRIDE